MTAARPVALVTGASSGIGEAAAIALTDAGFQVIGTSRDTSRVTARTGVTYLDLDVTSDESVDTLVQQVIDRFGRIDVLVNNAGLGADGAAEEISVAQTQRVFDVNVFGLMRMTKAVLPHMRAQRYGRVINISSVGGFVPNPFMASESLDHKVREHGLRVLLVQPGPINTPVRHEHGSRRHAAAAIRVPAAHVPRRDAAGDARRKRSRRRRQGDRHRRHRPETETAPPGRLDRRTHQRAAPHRARPDLRKSIRKLNRMPN